MILIAAERLEDFWRHYPALLYGLAALVGASTALFPLPSIFLFAALTACLLPHVLYKDKSAFIRKALALATALITFFYVEALYTFPTHAPIKGGTAIVDIESVSSAETPFGNLWMYKGTLVSYTVDGQIAAKGFPVAISIPKDKRVHRPQTGIRYQLFGTLKQTEQGKYAITPLRNAPWTPIGHFTSLSEWRFSAKSVLADHLHQTIADHHVREFLTGIATGEFDDRTLASELGRFGLQHLTAISGLHFSILATLLGFALCLLLPLRASSIVLIGLTTGYFIFLGSSPSVIRAWFTVTLALAAFLAGRRSLALNSLGVALLAVIVINPMAIMDIGFQFSFGITASILLLFSPFDALLAKLFQKRSLSEAAGMSLLNQHGYCVLHFFRQSLALCLAVNAAALPLTLFHFHKFPVMGLIYNLFFPPLVSISLLLLLLACASALLFPWLAALLHSVNEYYTGALLNLTFHLPKSWDALTWRVREVSPEMIIAYLAVLFLAGALAKHSQSCEDIAENPLDP